MYTLKGSLINNMITYPKLIITNFNIKLSFINDPKIISIIDKHKDTGKIIPTLSFSFLCILLKAILEATLTIREIHRIAPIINAVFSISKFKSNSSCINSFPFD